MEQRLCISSSSGEGTLKLSNFWLSPVPTKTKAGQMMEQRLCFIAAQEGHIEVVRFLIESGANKDQEMINGATPLFHGSSGRAHVEVVKFLVESGAKKDQCKTDDGATPLCM